jgi:hypothetical protein
MSHREIYRRNHGMRQFTCAGNISGLIRSCYRLPCSTFRASCSSSSCSFARAHMRMPSGRQSWIETRMGTWYLAACKLLDSFVMLGQRLTLQDRFTGIFWKCARIGERLSPYISICCVVMAVRRKPFHAETNSLCIFPSHRSAANLNEPDISPPLSITARASITHSSSCYNYVWSLG